MSLCARFVAATYDRMSASTEAAGLGAYRRALLSGAGGDVLEIGGGTGANVEFYGDGVRTLTICEPEPAMARRLQKRIADRRPRAAFVRAAAEELPFDDEQFDVAVSTLVLCSVDDQSQALRELRRVLRPTGRLLFIEHVRADDARLARWQDRITPLHVRLTNGCHCNRRTLDGIRGAGFEVTQLRHDTLKHVPPFVRPLIVGVSERRGT